jgi:hypothetical protein
MKRITLAALAGVAMLAGRCMDVYFRERGRPVQQAVLNDFAPVSVCG